MESPPFSISRHRSRGLSPRAGSCLSQAMTYSQKNWAAELMQPLLLLLHVEAQPHALGLLGLALLDHAAARPSGRARRCAARGNGRGSGRVERAGALDEAGEHRGLAQVELLGVDVEVVLGSGLDAVGAVTEVGGVEVALEDPVLGVLLLQSDRVAELAQLARVGVVGRGLALGLGVGLVDQRQLDQLLGDRRPALDDAVGGLVGEQGPERALHVERTVLVEAVVLDGHDRLDHDPRDLAERDDDPVLVVDRGDRVTVAVQDLGPLREQLGLQLLRKLVDRLRHVAGGEPQDACERDGETGHHDAEHRGHDQHHAEVRHHLRRGQTARSWSGTWRQGT